MGWDSGIEWASCTQWVATEELRYSVVRNIDGAGIDHNNNLQTSEVPLGSQMQGTSLFASSQRCCLEGSP